MMRRDGDRAVTVQIGAVLLLAIVFSALALYQVNVVPAENRAVEIDHNRQVHDGMRELRNAVRNVGTGVGSASASVSLGTRYPPRTLLVNPPDPAGTLETTGTGTVRIDNAAINGTYTAGADALVESDYETRTLVYEPSYNEYRDAPTTRIEHGFAINDFDDAAVPITEQPLVDGERITIVLVDGDLSASSSGTTAVDARLLSGPTDPVALESDGDNITITVPTRSPDAWNETIGSGFGSDSGEEHARVTAYADGQLTIELANDPNADYELRMARIGVGDGGERSDEFDITESEPESPSNNETSVAYEVGWEPDRMDDRNDRVSCTATGCTFTASDAGESTTATGVVTTDPAVDGAAVEYAVTNAEVATITPRESATRDGTQLSDIEARSNGTVGIFAAGGGTGDRLDLTVEVVPGGLPDGSVAYYDENGNGAYDDGESTYSATDLGGVDVPGSLIVVRDATRANGIDLSAGSVTVKAGSRLATENGGIDLTTTDGELTVGGTLDTTAGSGQSVSLDAAGRTTLSSGTVRSSGGIDVDSGGLVTAVDAELDASDASYGSISLTGADVSIERATVLTEGPITVTSAAALDATAADLESTGNGQTIALGSSGDMVLERGEISVGPDGTMTGELNQGRNDLTVSDAAFRQDGGPGTFDYSPNGVTVIGDPAVGSTR